MADLPKRFYPMIEVINSKKQAESAVEYFNRNKVKVKVAQASPRKYVIQPATPSDLRKALALEGGSTGGVGSGGFHLPKIHLPKLRISKLKLPRLGRQRVVRAGSARGVTRRRRTSRRR